MTSKLIQQARAIPHRCERCREPLIIDEREESFVYCIKCGHGTHRNAAKSQRVLEIKELLRGNAVLLRS